MGPKNPIFIIQACPGLLRRAPTWLGSSSPLKQQWRPVDPEQTFLKCPPGLIPQNSEWNFKTLDISLMSPAAVCDLCDGFSNRFLHLTSNFLKKINFCLSTFTVRANYWSVLLCTCFCFVCWVLLSMPNPLIYTSFYFRWITWWRGMWSFDAILSDPNMSCIWRTHQK